MWISFSLWAGGFFRNLLVVAPRWKRWAAIDASIEFRMTAFHCLLKDFYAPFLSLEETPERREREKKKNYQSINGGRLLFSMMAPFTLRLFFALIFNSNQRSAARRRLRSADWPFHIAIISYLQFKFNGVVRLMRCVVLAPLTANKRAAN